MAYTDLTPEQKTVLHEYVRMVRAWAGEQARTNNHALAISDDYTAQVQAIVAQCGANDVIVDGSGLAGVGQLTKTQLGYITGQLQAVLLNYNTVAQRQLWVIACGPGNLIG
jgi:hypothetical protein